MSPNPILPKLTPGPKSTGLAHYASPQPSPHHPIPPHHAPAIHPNPHRRQATANARLAGARLFFDPDLSCPVGFCPSNETDWRQNCPRRSDGPKRNHWKLIVIPNRTVDVAVHQFTPHVPFVRRHLWGTCLQHRPLQDKTPTALSMSD